MNEDDTGTRLHPEQPSPGEVTDDPVLARRARIKALCDLGSRVGYSCLALALLGFFVALFIGFPKILVMVVIAVFLFGLAVLLPTIVLGYGVKAADAEDRGEKFGY